MGDSGAPSCWVFFSAWRRKESEKKGAVAISVQQSWFWGLLSMAGKAVDISTHKFWELKKKENTKIFLQDGLAMLEKEAFVSLFSPHYLHLSKF